MLTGKPAFAGKTLTQILARAIERELDWTLLPASTPPRIRELLRLCLEKNARNRRSDATDVRLDIEQALAEPVTAVPATLSARSSRLAWVARAFTAIVIIALAIPAVRYLREAPLPPAAPLRFSAELGADVSLSANLVGVSTLAVSPHGAVLAFAGAKNGSRQLYLRRLGQLQASPLAGTGGAINPFFSPDGQWLAFFADGKLKKISVTGGPAVTLADASGGRGGAWGDDGNIVFTPAVATGTGLRRVSSGGGKAEPLTKLGEGEAVHRWPQVLPGAKSVLFTSHSAINDFDAANIVVQPLPAGVPNVVVRGGYHALYVASGHILYIHDGTLFAVPFDLNRLEVTGQAVPAIEGVNGETLTGAAQFALSNAGTLAYLPGGASGNEAPVQWMTPDGKTIPLRAMPSDWSSPQFSPAGRRLALDILSGNNYDVWIYEWARDTLTRLTFDAATDWVPVWTPDGRRIVFASHRDKGAANLYWQHPDGTGEGLRLTESGNLQFPSSFHPNGKVLAFQEGNPKTGNDLMILPLEGDEASGWKPGKPSVFLNTPADEKEAMFSPDGRWIAYDSNESGRFEVFVRPFPGPGGKWQISTGSGSGPTWSRTRHELLYLGPDNRIMAASYTVDSDSFKADKPRLWSEQAILPRLRPPFFDLHPDGERLAVAVAAGGQAKEKIDKVTFVVNFFDELRRIAPSSK